MNPLIRSFIGAGVRWLVTILAAHGVAVSDDQATTIINAIMVVGMLAWSWYQKYQADRKLDHARATGL